jgi:16S rRNA (adenine1518-N6/adenine1519-N6)-dimethyltransferase
MRTNEGHRARKRFGQHFLADRSVVEAIANAIAPRANQTIVEIGPGLAALTDALLERVETIHAVEIDRDLAARLRRRYPEPRLLLHEADALGFDYGQLLRGEGLAENSGLRVVGNLPYNISSPLLVRLLDFRRVVTDQHFMLQKEVVDRIVSPPGVADFGRLSVLMQMYYDCEKLFDVPPEAFDPPPRVDSAVLRMSVRRDRAHEAPAPLQQVLAVAFGQRRKMLRGTLLPWLVQRGLGHEGIEPTARAEEISIDIWRALAFRLAEREGGATSDI